MIFYLLSIAGGLAFYYFLKHSEEYKSQPDAMDIKPWFILPLSIPFMLLIDVLDNLLFFMLLAGSLAIAFDSYRKKNKNTPPTPDKQKHTKQTVQDVNNIRFEYHQPKKQPELVNAQVFNIDRQYIRAHNIDKDKKQAYFAGWIKGLITDTDTNKHFSVADWLAAANTSPYISVNHKKPTIKNIDALKETIARNKNKTVKPLPEVEPVAGYDVRREYNLYLSEDDFDDEDDLYDEDDSIDLIDEGEIPSSDFDIVHFDYINANNEFSSREVHAKSFESEYFQGFCVLRRQLRTFRYDRIEGYVSDVETGESISVGAWRRVKY